MREKLIELLVRTPCNGSEEIGCCPSRKYGFCGEVNKLSYCTIQHIADHLIANGVTIPVRCKDCYYYHRETLTCRNGYGCGSEHPNWYEDDFCSYGERKDNG